MLNDRIEDPATRAPGRSRILVWLSLLLLALIAGAFSRHLGLGQLGAGVYAALGFAYVLISRGQRVVAALQASVVLLAVAESVLAPGLIATAGPLLVTAMLVLALVLDKRVPRVRPALVLVGALGLAFVLPTLVAQSPDRALKAVGIAVMWFVVVGAASVLVGSAEIRALVVVVLGIGLVVVAVAVIESLLELQVVREWVAADATGQYIVRANTILGDWTNRAQATFGYPIPLAAFLSVCLVASIVVPKLTFGLRASLIVAFGAGIVLTGSRSAVAAAGAGVVVYSVSLLLSRRLAKPRRAELILPLAVSAAAAVFVTFFLVRAVATDDFSLVHRGGMIEVVLGALPRDGWWTVLFGGGYGSVESGFEQGLFGQVEAPVVDNVFASGLIMMGVIGVAILVALILLSLWTGSDQSRALLATVVGCFFFFDVLQWHAVSILFFILVGVSSRPGDVGRTRLGRINRSGPMARNA